MKNRKNNVDHIFLCDNLKLYLILGGLIIIGTLDLIQQSWFIHGRCILWIANYYVVFLGMGLMAIADEGMNPRFPYYLSLFRILLSTSATYVKKGFKWTQLAY